MDVPSSHQTAEVAATHKLVAGDLPTDPLAPAPRHRAGQRPKPLRSNSDPRRSVCLIGLGTAVPELSIPQQQSAEIAAALVPGRHARLLPALYRRSGVQNRHSVVLREVDGKLVADSLYQPARDVHDQGPSTASRINLYETEAPGLAAAACRDAFARSGVVSEEVTNLVTVSCSGFSAPGVDLQLINDLQLRPDVSRTNVGFMGCHGLMNGLRVATAYARSDPDAVVLVAAVELCSLHHQYTDRPEQIVANSLFGDGAAALIIRHEAGPQGGWRLSDQRSVVIPGTADMMSWRIGDYGFEMTLSAGVPDVIRQTLNPWLNDWLAEFGLSTSEIDAWAIHPGGPRILSAVGDAASIKRSLLQPSFDILASFGNMSSPTVAFILDRLQRAGQTPPCVMLAFGPGLTVEAALWR